MDETVLVLKLNERGEEVWRYSGRVLERGPSHIRIEALFNLPDFPLHGLVFKKGDRFVETFYTDRWYNIFEMHDRDDGQFKGWYCNISRPAEIRDGEVAWTDLALDVLAFPDGRRLVLDEDEFDALEIDESTRSRARQALVQLVVELDEQQQAGLE